MSLPSPRPGDQARAMVLVRLPREETFRIFTEEIDQWWRRGMKFREAGKRRGIIALEPGVGGRMFEEFEDARGRTRVVQTGEVLVWDPPSTLTLRWRNSAFSPEEATEVQVDFVESPSGTRVTVTHRGWADIRPDHPARHGQEVVAFIGGLGRWWGDLLQSLQLHAAK